MVLGLFVEGERRHDVQDCGGSCIRMKTREASGKRYFTTKRKEVLLGSSQFRQGGARWCKVECNREFLYSHL